MLRLANLLLILFSGTIFGAPVPKEVKRGVALEGTWEVLEFQSQGRVIDTYVGSVWKIGTDVIDIEYPVATGMAAMRNKINSVDITSASKNLDYTNSQGTDRRCIFEIDGETLTLCIPLTSERPEELKPALANLLYKFKRVKE